MAGAPVIGLSRVPVATLLDYLAAGDTLADVLRDFPSVDREKAIGALDAIKDAVGLASGLTTDEAAVREDPLMHPFTNHSVMTHAADFMGREEPLRL